MVPPHPAPGGANADCQRLLASLVLLGSWICLHLPLPPLWAAEEGGCLSCSHLTLLPLGVPPDSLSCTLPVRALSPFCLDSTTFLHRLSLLPSLNKHGPLVNILATSLPKPSEISFLSFHDKSPLALSPPNLPSAPRPTDLPPGLPLFLLHCVPRRTVARNLLTLTAVDTARLRCLASSSRELFPSFCGTSVCQSPFCLTSGSCASL